MGLSSKLGRRFRSDFIGRGIYIITTALLTVGLARLLDPDGYGLFFLAISVLATFKVFSRLGIAKSTGKYVATYKEQDPAQIRHILRFGLLLNLFVLGITSVVLFFTYEYIARIIGEPELAPFLLIGILYLSFSTLNYFALKTLQGFEAIEKTASIRVVRGVVKFVLAFGFVLMGFGAIGAFVGYLLAYAVAGAIGFFYLYYRFYRGIQREPQEPGLQRRIAEYSIPITATSTASKIDRHFDTILVGFFIGPTSVAFYTISKQVIGFIETPATALSFTLAPTYEAQKQKGNPEVTARIFEEGVSHTLLLYVPAAAGLILVAEPIIELVFGEDYLGAIPVLQVLALYIVFHTVNKTVGSGLDFLGRARDRAIARGVSAVLNVLLNIILIPSIGVVGAAIATVISYSLYTLTNIYIMSTEVKLRSKYLIGRSLSATGVAVVMAAVVFLFLDSIGGFFTLFSVVLIGVAVWAGLVTMFGLLDVRQIISVIV